MNDWVVKLPGRIRPVVEEMAREDYLPATDYVRALVQRAVFEKQLARKQQQREQPKTA